MKHRHLIYMLLLSFSSSYAQTEVHNTMFMFNKLLYNPAYAGTRDITSVNAYYRDQWTAIDGAPKTYGVTFDAAIANKNKETKDLAVGLSFTSEKIGVENKQNIVGYYAFHIQMKNESVLSLGLSGGVQLYSANYSLLNPLTQNDPNLVKDVKNALLPNFGGGFFWYNKDFYLGGAIPNLIQNYYDKNEKAEHYLKAQQVRAYYLNSGYVFHSGESFDLLPQLMFRYNGNGTYRLPASCDINVSMIFYKRLLLGVTYRTDNSFEGIFHMQVAQNINIGYAYDYLLSPLNGYNNGAHELVVGIDFVKKESRYDRVHYVKMF